VVITTLLAVAILLHELLYVTRDGCVYLERCFVPTLGLQLNSRWHVAAHLGLMTACVWMAVRPTSWPGHVVVLLVLSLVIASYSLRLSNHLIVAWFMLMIVVLSDVFVGIGGSRSNGRELVLLGMQVLVIVTYFLAAFHKLNRDYFSPHVSYAAQLAAFLCWDRGVRNPSLVRGFSRYSIYSTVAFEAAIPIFLLVPVTRAWGLLLALMFQFSLALLGIVNFSAVMYAGLAAFLPLASHDWTTAVRLSVDAPGALATAGLAAVLAVWLVTPRNANRFCPYRHRNAAWIIQVGFGLLTAWLMLNAGNLVLRDSPAETLHVTTASLALCPVLAFYLVNGMSPYLGLKSEFSMAMFSNLRSNRWNHLVFRDRWRMRRDPDYIVVREIAGLPDAESVAKHPAGELARAALDRSATLQYSPYFFFESLGLVARLTPDATPVLAQVRYRSREYTLVGEVRTTLVSPEFPKWRRITAFPFLLPVDERVPAAEQGFLLSDDGSRQLF
jgi:hypothetical protein